MTQVSLSEMASEVELEEGRVVVVEGSPREKEGG
jgi:hypothetical protein